VAGDAHGLAEGIAADLQHAQPVDLADARAADVDEQRTFFDHFADARLDQVVPLHFRRQCTADVRGANDGFALGCAS